MSAKKNGKKDWVWPLIVIFFVIGGWPVALFLLFYKLAQKDSEKSGGMAWKGTKKPGSPAWKKTAAVWMQAIGGILLLAGIVNFVEAVDMMIWLQKMESYYVEDLVAGLAMAIAGGFAFGKGQRLRRALKRYAKYLAVMGDQASISVEELARTLGYSPDCVERDLQKMIDSGYFGGKAYLNVELGWLFRDGRSGEDAYRRQQAQQAAVQREKQQRQTESEYSSILRKLREANDRIEDHVLSEKIDRIEAVTARIFKAVEEDPQKQGKINTFLSYYVPTTQKLLDAYAEFEAAGVEGENLRQAKGRIEATMDSVIRGFEHQLDELYKADAMDVDSDIRVLETMLSRDAATAKRDFGLCGSAVAQVPEEE